MSYPISADMWSLDHKGGTKSYHFLVLGNNDGHATVILRYGKTGTFGQFMVTNFTSLSEAQHFASKKADEKDTGGYQQTSESKRRIINNRAELATFIGGVNMSNYKKKNPNFLSYVDPVDPGADAVNEKAMQSEAALRNQEKAQRDFEAKAKLEELLRQQDLAEKAVYANNPNFRRF